MTTLQSQQEIALMAHLLRRASFGATRDELERYLEKGYEATVEELLNPTDAVYLKALACADGPCTTSAGGRDGTCGRGRMRAPLHNFHRVP